MNKVILFSAALMLGASSAYAFVEPQAYENVSFQSVAPNGSIVVSEVYGNMVIYDLANDRQYTYETAGDDPYYTSGLGNSVSNTGIVLGSTSNSNDAAYWENGEWKHLDTEGVIGTNNLSNGITPDGSRICGSIGAAEISLDSDNTMLLPVYWDRNANGTYGKYTILPHPELDLYGRVPQYVTANSISDDGKTIIGQLVDCSGYLYTPIVYTQNDEGEWSYKILLKDLFLPEGTVIPEDPGESPARPNEADYMTPEELAAYDAAYQEWIDSGYTGTVPNAEDYMTEEDKAAYNAALEAWQLLFDEWDAKSTAFYEAFYAIVEAAPQFEFNSVRITPDGKKYITTTSTVDESDPNSRIPTLVYQPCAISLEDETFTKYGAEGLSLQLSSVPNNNVCLATTGLGSIPMTSYIISLTDGSITSVEDFLGSFSPELKEWVNANLGHEVEIYDWETETSTFETYVFTGMAHASADLTTFVTWEDGGWGSWVPSGVIFKLSQTNSISTPEASAKAKVWFDNDGNLNVEGEVTNVEVYDLSGRRVLSTIGAGTTSSQLGEGIYIVKANTVDGGSFSAKIVR